MSQSSRSGKVRKTATKAECFFASALACFFSSSCRAVWAAPTVQEQFATALGKQADAESKNPATRALALVHINKALEISPNNVYLIISKACITEDLGEYEQSEQCFKRASQISPSDDFLKGKQARMLVCLKRYKEALAVADRAIGRQANAGNRLIMVHVLKGMKNFDEAETEADKVLELEPKNDEAHSLRAEAAEKTGHWEKVLADDNFLLNLGNEKDSSLYFTICQRARANTHLKKYAGAIADYKAAAKLFPLERKVHENLLSIYKMTGDTAAARVESNRLKEFDDEFAPSK